MTRTRTLLWTMILFPALCIAGSSQTPATSVPLSLQVVLSRYQGDTRLSVQSHVLDLEANGKPVSVRKGSQIVSGPGGQQTIQQVGTQIDCLAKAISAERFKVSITLTVRDVGDDKQIPPSVKRVPSIPTLSNFIVATPLILDLGKTTEIYGTSRLTNEKWKAEITLSARGTPVPSVTTAAAKPAKIQIVFSKYEGTTKVSTPYILWTSTSGETSSLRLGTEIAIDQTPAGATGQIRYSVNQLGSQIDTTVAATDDGRYTLQITATSRLVAPNGQFDNFVSTKTLTLRDGETTQYTGTDGTSGEAVTLDVTLNIGE